MAKTEPVKFDFDTKMLDIVTENVDKLLVAYEGEIISAENALGGIRDLITLARNVPRFMTIDVEKDDE